MTLLYRQWSVQVSTSWQRVVLSRLTLPTKLRRSLELLLVQFEDLRGWERTTPQDIAFTFLRSVGYVIDNPNRTVV